MGSGTRAGAVPSATCAAQRRAEAQEGWRTPGEPDGWSAESWAL